MCMATTFVVSVLDSASMVVGDLNIMTDVCEIWNHFLGYYLVVIVVVYYKYWRIP